jgi:hypothetical protein
LPSSVDVAAGIARGVAAAPSETESAIIESPRIDARNVRFDLQPNCRDENSTGHPSNWFSRSTWPEVREDKDVKVLCEKKSVFKIEHPYLSHIL